MRSFARAPLWLSAVHLRVGFTLPLLLELAPFGAQFLGNVAEAQIRILLPTTNGARAEKAECGDLHRQFQGAERGKTRKTR